MPPGQTLGVVGPTGAGKSTLLHLLLRHYAPGQGTITWDGTPLADYRLATLRAQIAWVPQEAFLFSASIADNIALARADASRADIEGAARLADLHDDILRFPHGYETRVGERGVTLSGGQRQRVAIARALLSDAPLLLLDDALSAVDTGTETRILAHLRDGTARPQRHHRQPPPLGRGRCRPHRGAARKAASPSTASHAELLERDGWYAAQWRYQQLEASLEAA